MRRGLFALSTLLVASLAAAPRSKAAPLPGEVGDFSVFVLGDAKLSGQEPASNRSVVHGPTAIGGNAFFDSVNVTAAFPDNALVVKGILDYAHGAVTGDIVAGGRATLVDVTRKNLLSNPAIDFAGAAQVLANAAGTWAHQRATGGASLEADSREGDVQLVLTLEGTGAAREVFSISTGDLSLADRVEFRGIAPGATVLVNVSGKLVFLSKSTSGRTVDFDLGGADPRRILFNFFEARDVAIMGGGGGQIDVRGTIFAPFAAVRIDVASVAGSLVAASLVGSKIEVATSGAFDGSLPAPLPFPAPAVPEPPPSGPAREAAKDVDALGPAAGFGIFAIRDLAASRSSSVGRVAVGGAAALRQYEIGAQPDVPVPCLQQVRFSSIPSAGTRDDLVVGGTLEFRSGAIHFGNARAGGKAALESVRFDPPNRFLEGSPIDFEAAGEYLRVASVSWASLPANGETIVLRGDESVAPNDFETSITFLGLDPDLDVFFVRGIDLSVATRVRFLVPASATVLVNVAGEVVELEGIQYDLNEGECEEILEVADRRKVLLNFFEAKRLRVHRANLPLSILAPLAHVRIDACEVHGSLVVDSCEGAFARANGELFAGFLPRVEGIEPFSPALGPAAGFNIFVTGDFNVPGPLGNSQGFDVQGRVAAGGNAFLTHFAAGDDGGANEKGVALSQSFGARDDLIVGGILDVFQAHFPKGNARSGGRAGFDFVGFGPGSGYVPGNPIDFEAAGEYLRDVSDFWASLEPNGVTQRDEFDNTVLLALGGNNTTLNVFLVDGKDLSVTRRVDIDFPPEATVLVNVNGTEVQMDNVGFRINGVEGGISNDTARQHILWNFFEAEKVTFRRVAVEGTVLAPRAALDTGNNSFEGQVIGASWDGQGEPHNFPFLGTLPPLPPVEPPPPPIPEPKRRTVRLQGHGGCAAGGMADPWAFVPLLSVAAAALARRRRAQRHSASAS
jgi:choice-of-anchor A domain-containing protein/MYXO-CTERM domain-containing protein